MSHHEEGTEADTFCHSGPLKRKSVIGPMDRYVTRSSPPSPSLDERREQAKCIVQFMGMIGGQPKKFIKSKYSENLIEALAQCGPSSFNFPTEEEMKYKYLTDEVNRIKKKMLKDKVSWENHGCSILLDTWSDRRQSCLMNVNVHCPLGTRFLRFIATDKYCVECYVWELIGNCVELVGAKNVVQIVRDETPFCVEACKAIQEDWPHIFQTPCTSYQIDKILNLVCALPCARSVLFKAKALVGFIYNHKSTLTLLERVIGQKGLIRVGITGPTTTFFVLRRLLMVRGKLVNMFTEDECKQYKWWGHPKVNEIIGVVQSSEFWRDLYMTFRVIGPLIKVLYMVHNLKVPQMGFIYAAMLHAKDEIKKACLNREKLYKPVLEIINKIWGASADNPLYMAAYYLNPFYFYGNREIEKDEQIMNGLIECIQHMYADDTAVQNKIIEELGAYRESQGPFGKSMAVHQRSDPNINPDRWWAMYGYKTPHLQAMARRVLNLTCTASQLEKCWRTFEKVFWDEDFEPDAKVRSRRMFACANLKLEEKWQEKVKDPLAAYELDNAYGWIADTASEVDQDIVAPVTGLEWDPDVDEMNSGTYQDSDPKCSALLKLKDESYDSGNEGDGDNEIDVDDYFDETPGIGEEWNGEEEYLGCLDDVNDWN